MAEERGIVLVVDDEPAVRQLAGRVLARRGHRVVEAEDGAGALEAAEAADAPIDLLLSDVVLPGMHGAELARTLLERYPDLKVIFMSGFAEEELASRGIGEIGASYISKPFTVDVLGLMVDGALER